MKKKKKISVQTIIEVMIRAVFFIIYPALFSTAFTGIKLIVEQITQRASLQWNSFVETLVVLLVLPLYLDDFSVALPVHLEHGVISFILFHLQFAKKEKRNR